MSLVGILGKTDETTNTTAIKADNDGYGVNLPTTATYGGGNENSDPTYQGIKVVLAQLDKPLRYKGGVVYDEKENEVFRTGREGFRLGLFQDIIIGGNTIGYNPEDDDSVDMAVRMVKALLDTEKESSYDGVDNSMNSNSNVSGAYISQSRNNGVGDGSYQFGTRKWW